MHALLWWTASMVLAFALAACGESVDTSSGAGGSGGDATTSGATMSSGSSTASSSASMAGSGGSGGGSMAGSGGAGGSSCMPKTTDPSEIDTDCEATMQCSPGYTCHPFHGFIMQWQCEILCTASCECPAGLQCVTVSDKMSSWMQCGP